MAANRAAVAGKTAAPAADIAGWARSIADPSGSITAPADMPADPAGNIAVLAANVAVCAGNIAAWPGNDAAPAASISSSTDIPAGKAGMRPDPNCCDEENLLKRVVGAAGAPADVGTLDAMALRLCCKSLQLPSVYQCK